MSEAAVAPSPIAAPTASSPTAASPSNSARSLPHEGVRLLMTNQFNAAQEFFVAHAKEDIKVALLQSLVAYLNAVCSHADSELTSALATIWATEKQARSLTSSHVLSEHIESLLIQADTHILGAMVQFVQQSFIKAAWNIRKSHQYYHTAQDMIETQQEQLPDKEEDAQKDANDDEEDADSSLTPAKLSDLRGWVEFGVGLFNLFLSLLPPTVLKVAEIIGYSGDRDYALKLLKHSQHSPSFMAPFSCLLLLTYYLTISAFTGDEDPAFLPEAKQLLDVRSSHKAAQ